ncbi:RagB/SusD family nutrient uptake outer membrane protein [uncultured Parabacteroides sp.]|uniref:RagB/SusD family nutrient uptake outer membrane protein n=1 Tax=uncultured Parabacteroides sp. TaxID=512312 RepID=UPI0025E370B8|nr:RagB/SusD family nutrient uptake outer membrane protein [uncultured Parabacteroides sp.]
MKIYKKSLLYGALAFALCMVGGCNSNIDLDPEGIITADGYFKSAEDYEKALTALYERLNVNNYDLWMDGVTDNGLVTHSWNRGYDIGRGIGNTASSFPSDKWNNGYVSVQRANNVINNIDKYEWPGGESDANRNKVLGEARTLRAYFYLDLVSIFGHIMFYTENPATVAESKTVEQIQDPKKVFDFILDDLDKAIAALPDKPDNKSKIGKPAARLLRARAAAIAAGYLKDKSYFQITLAETSELVASAPQLADFDKLFVTGCEDLDEVILVRRYSLDATNGWGDWYNQSIGGYCVTTPVKALADAFEYVGERNEARPYLNKDPRFYETIYAPGMELRGKYFNTIPNNVVEKDGKTYFDPSKDYGALQDKEVSVGDVLAEGGGGEWNKTPTGLAWKKYYQEPETWTTYNSFIIFRYAEAYLLRAEALVETGGSADEAKAMVKVVRDRAGNTNDIDKMVAERYNGNLLDLIRNERRVELAQEGLRFADIRRWNILLDVMNKPIEGVEYRDFSSGTPKHTVLIPAERDAYTARDFWWPIPQAEIDLNPDLIQQNDGWK